MGNEIFPFQSHEHDQHTEVVRFCGAGSAATATQIGKVTHKLQLQVSWQRNEHQVLERNRVYTLADHTRVFDAAAPYRGIEQQI